MEQSDGPIREGDATQPVFLVVATDSSVRAMLAMALRVEYSGGVVGVSNGREALRVIEQVRPEVVVISSQLYDLPALALAKRLHALPGWERLPIILTHPLAGTSGESQQLTLVMLQAPFSVEKLYAAVDRCLGRT